MKTRFRLKIFGKVQGVYYRKSTKETADKLKIYGWVKNQPDGSVLAEIEGHPAPLSEMLEWCFLGPERASVHTIEKEEIKIENSNKFDIHY